MHQQLAKHNPTHRAAFVEIVTNSARARQASQQSSPWQLQKLLISRSELTPPSCGWSTSAHSSESKTRLSASSNLARGCSEGASLSIPQLRRRFLVRPYSATWFTPFEMPHYHLPKLRNETAPTPVQGSSCKPVGPPPFVRKGFLFFIIGWGWNSKTRKSNTASISIEHLASEACGSQLVSKSSGIHLFWWNRSDFYLQDRSFHHTEYSCVYREL